MIQAMVSCIITSSSMAEKLLRAAAGSSINKPTITPASKDSIGRRLNMAVTTVTSAGSSTSKLVSVAKRNLLYGLQVY
jgi:hypothetical protein